MLLIRKGRRNMNDENDWIYKIIPSDEVDSMNSNAKRIERNMSGGVSVVMSADNESAMEMCQYWQRCMMGDPMAWLRISSFMSGIIATLEVHLNEEGINPYEE
jgi:hypothetical protein